MQSIFKNYRAVLFLNSPDIDPNLASYFPGKVIAADGAYDRLKQCGITADLVIGDLDSTSVKSIECKTRLIMDQSLTDFQKALEYLVQQKIDSCLISGLFGGQADHILGNCMVFCSYSCQLKLLSFHKDNNSRQLLWPISKGELSISCKAGATITILSFEPCQISSDGLRWELDSLKITSSGPYSLRNVASKNYIKFKVEEGQALVIQSLD